MNYKIMKKTQRQKAKNNADKWFSLYIRLKDADSNGIAKCFTCDKFLHYKSIQNGHFISRQHNSTRFLEKNCFCQCMMCNVFLHGNYIEYTLRLIKEKGKKYVDDLKKLQHTTVQLSQSDLEKIAEKYKKKVIKMSNYEK